MKLTLESLLTSDAGFALTSATPLQRAIMRAAEGRPIDDILEPYDRMKFFGMVDVPLTRPRLVTLIAGIRSGKTFIAGAAALHSALTADLRKLPRYEKARVTIVAPTVSTADITFSLLTGAINEKPHLRALVAGKVTSDTITIKRGDGRLVDIVVVAAHRGGITIRGSWLAGFVLEETAFFGADQQGYKVNAEELLRASRTRLVPGGQGWIISSPMGAQGLLHDLWRAHFGQPGTTLVVRAPTLAMTGGLTISAEEIEEERKRDPDAASREYDAEWSDSDAQLIAASHLDLSRRSQLFLPPVEGCTYAAAMDPATRGNAWTLAIGTRDWRDGKIKQVIALAQQWQGSKVKPLSPDAVLKEIALIVKLYGLTTITTDQFSADALRVIARRHGVTLWDRASTATENVDLYTSLATKFADEMVEIPDDPVVRADLLAVRKKVTSRVSIVLPRTPDGRHSDYAPVIARVIDMPTREPPPPRLVQTAMDRAVEEAAEERAVAMRGAAKRQRVSNKRLNRQLKRGNYRAIS